MEQIRCKLNTKDFHEYLKMIILLLCATIRLSVGEWVKEMENPGLFQGDIVLDDDVTYGSIKGGRWPNAVVPYELSASLTPEVLETFPKAIAEYHKHTCIRFKKRTTETEYLYFQDGRGCSSPVGHKKGRVNKITLARGCDRLGTVMHEIGHSLGLHHEQSRPDRDDYVNIILENIPLSVMYNFGKEKAESIDSLGTPYDYLSMMHYSGTAFGSGKTTIVTKDPYYQDKIGQRKGFSDIDKIQVNRMYCEKDSLLTPAPPKVTTPYDYCKDDYEEICAFQAKYCKTSPRTRLFCCKTCRGQISTGLPTGSDCRDNSSYPCDRWASEGLCNKYPLTAAKHCCRTCTEQAGKTTPVPTAKPCLDDPKLPCPRWAKEGTCEKYPNIASTSCCKSCKGKGGSVTSKPTVAGCHDNEHLPCSRWAKEGTCQKYPNIAATSCCKSCKGVV